MSFIKEFVKNIYYDVISMKDSSPEEKYFAIMKKYADFTKKFPLVVSYMCRYNLYNEKLFIELTDELEKTRPKYEDSFVAQAKYIKKLLVASGVSRGKALKISNGELEEVMKQINSINKQERELKKKDEQFTRETAEERRRELLDFVLQDMENL